MPLKVGITGGIGSGKSTVCHIFELLGVPVYYADTRSRELVNAHGPVRSAIISLLGEEAYDGAVQNRAFIARKVFGNPDLLQQLNGIIHPAVAENFNTWSAGFEVPYLLKEAAILIESGSYKQLDELIVVTAPEEVRIRRVAKRDAATTEEIRRRMSHQLSDVERLAYADFHISNDDRDMLIPQVLGINRQLLALIN